MPDPARQRVVAGMTCYTGRMFTKNCKGLFVAWPDGTGGAGVEPCTTDFVEDNPYLGRRVDCTC